MCSDGMHPQVLRVLAGRIVGPLLLMFGRLWSSGEVHQGWEERKCHFCLQEGQERVSGEVQAGLPHFDHWESDGGNKHGNHS